MNEIHVLLVDDDLNYRQILNQLLSTSGFHVIPAGNGMEALKLLNTGRFDMVLMDIQMPFMDGITAFEHIKSLKPEDKPLVIACSAFFSQDQKTYLKQHGFDELMVKPLDIKELIAICKKYINRNEGKKEDLMILNPAKIEEISKYGGKADLLPIYENFEQELEQVIVLLKEALSSNDGTEALRLMHTLKGNAASLGAEKLHDVAREIENTLKAGIKDLKKDYIFRLEQAIFELKGIYKTLLTNQ
jgi:CheY-like chemotaxis protein/HPt (histidine-containing phosphotransfer) domain-containing protein